MNIIMASLLAAVASVVAPTSNIPGPDNIIRNPDGTIKRFSKAEFEKLPEAVKKAHRKELAKWLFGDKLEKPNSAQGRFNFIISTESVNPADLKKAIDSISKVTKIQMEAIESRHPFAVENVSELLKANSANAGVFVVDSNVLPRLMLAPEEGWAVINAAKLTTDNPSRAVLVKRVNIEAVRAFAFICGSCNDTRSGVIMREVSKLSDLDEIPSAMFIPTSFAQMGKQLGNYGIKPRIVKVYRQACEEGWAPAPTNEYQKAIWDKVHAMPQNPMKIEFDPKKGR